MVAPENAPNAVVDFDDLKGSCAADLIDGEQSLKLLADRCGIPADKYTPVGMNILVKQNVFSVLVYVLNHDKINQSNFEVEEIGVDIMLHDLFAYCTQLNIVLFDKTKALDKMTFLQTFM